MNTAVMYRFSDPEGHEDFRLVLSGPPADTADRLNDILGPSLAFYPDEVPVVFVLESSDRNLDGEFAHSITGVEATTEAPTFALTVDDFLTAVAASVAHTVG